MHGLDGRANPLMDREVVEALSLSFSFFPVRLFATLIIVLYLCACLFVHPCLWWSITFSVFLCLVMSLSLSIYLSIHQSVYLSVLVSSCFYHLHSSSIYPFKYLPVHLSTIHLSIQLSIFKSIYLTIHRSVCLFMYLSKCPSLNPLSMCLPLSLCLNHRSSCCTETVEISNESP